MLIVIPDVLDAEQLRDCRQALEQAQWEDGRKTAGYLAVQSKRNVQLPLNSPLSQKMGEFLLRVLDDNAQFIAAALPANILPPRFNRYEGGGEYGNHIDNAIFSVPGTGERLRTDVSSTLFFSEPDEYEGGELMIEDVYGQQSIKLPAGHLVVYPGTSLHRVNPVTAGTRYASFFWTQSMVRHAHQRSVLWELDQCIQSLAKQGAHTDELARLSGVYHNLLREWAQV
ncbi:Fe2+-dependent dioxygenase [Alcaligenes endophyticus]|uniref:Fe2+-dependent dioxygenase n=1 Tax=Alcaligenes endophyticus TaxID=1929088 RepID=A0ABT8ELX7_9BURK|nr:Fe2+-dependent dioxygenase [Alcaligenes endophyticus]MCX5591119.1 Fe2+-dependent dioxygenase [Alcaligenes endophyticus]MDN4122303.1 Fe2+-dependent dioxygenase [Alcaligenes endophyticus]